MEDVIIRYADRCFSYAMVVWLLYERKDVTTAVKESINQLTLAVSKLSTLIDERIK
jgi:hypothetical protein